MIFDEKINSIDWFQYKDLEPEKVIDSLKKLCELSEEKDNNNTYNLVLSSIGNNHSGTYYSVTVSALPIILEIAQQGYNEISQNCALEILSDLYYCFEPEIKTCDKISLCQLEKFVRGSIEEFVEKEYNQIKSDRNKVLVVSLLEYIKDEDTI